MRKLLVLGALVATASFVACSGTEEEQPPPPPPPPPEVDAGRDYDRDGGGALELLGAVNESSAALAWRASQGGEVAQWEILAEGEDGIRFPVANIPGSTLNHTLPLTAGETQRVFVVGLGADGEIVQGTLAEADPDAGMIECYSAVQCAQAEVCSLNQCETVTCTSDDVCPTGYTCGDGDGGADVCTRGADYDAGTDIGEFDAGAEPQVSRPFVSELIELSPATPAWSAPTQVSEFAGQIEDSVALDTAGQLVIVRQSGQLFAHRTDVRGASFAPVRIDTLGTKARVAFNRDTQTLFACYGAGQVVRVRKSTDFGRTWEPTALDLGEQDTMDAGVTTTIADCDIAAWSEGNVLVAAVENPGDSASVKLYTVSPALELNSTDTAFVSSTAVFSPRNMAIAADPTARRVHILFTGLRLDQNSARDQEIYAVRRDSTTGSGFSAPELVSVRGIQGTGSQGVQDSPTVIIDPETGRGVAAYVSNEPAPNNPPSNTIYVSMFDDAPGRLRWGTGTDLDVFEQVPFTQNPAEPFIVLPQRASETEPWAAFAPRLVVGPNNELLLYFLAGPTAGNTRFEPYVVGFSLTEPSPSTQNAIGWYLAPAERIGSDRVHSLSTGDIRRGSWSATADSQISRYIFYTVENGSPSAPNPGAVRYQHKP